MMLTMHYAKDPHMPVSSTVQSAQDMAHTTIRKLPFTMSSPMLDMHLVHSSMPHFCLLHAMYRAESSIRG